MSFPPFVRISATFAAGVLLASSAYFGVQRLAAQENTAQDAVGSRGEAAPHEAMVNQYCMGCHNERVRRADLVLDPATLSDPEAAGETWEKVVRKLRAGAMPPQGMPRPDAAAMDGFLTYLEGSLDAAAEGHLDPGRATVHRLNRSEYENAVRDLLALDVNAAELLPPDDESYGFDNNADVLGVSPALLEQYVSASAKVARLAVGDPNILPKATTYRTRPDLSQTDRVRGLPLGTRGGLVEKHNFPLDGEYEFSIELATNTAEILRGLEQQHEIEILIDNARIFLTKIGGVEDTKAMEKNPIVTRQEIRDRLTVRVPITAGPHRVGATFVKKNSAYEDYILQPFLRTTLDPVNEAGLPHIESMTIAGPFSIEGPGETPSREKIFTCRPDQGAGESKDEVACAREILSTLARQAYRRPVTDADMEPLLSFYQSSRNRGNNFDQGIESAIRLILSNPQFIFRFEPEPGDVAPGGVYPVSDLELASRLSFFLWSSVPDEPLLELAEQGKLRDRAILEQQIRRMLADPKADALVDNFAAQWLFLRNMKGTFPDPQAFPNFDDNLRQDLETETKLFVGSIFRDDRSVLDLLRADYTFMNERVARHYGVNGVYGNRFRRVKLDDPNRFGLLGQASILSVTSHTTRTSPVLRGKWILSNLLGTPPPPPPPNVPALAENGEGGTPSSVRERMELHRANPPCSSCHSVMDPLGFALENFDAVGRWRTLDSGQPIDSSGTLVDGSEVNGPVEMREALLDRPEVFLRNFTEKLMTYALGRGLDWKDMPAVRKVVHDAARNDYRFASIVQGIVESTPFQMKKKSDAVSGTGEADRLAAR